MAVLFKQQVFAGRHFDLLIIQITSKHFKIAALLGLKLSLATQINLHFIQLIKVTVGLLRQAIRWRCLAHY